MLKKLVVGAIAAGVLGVPLAGVAGADPSLDNPGTPGNFGKAIGATTGIPPGQIIKQRAQLPGSAPKGRWRLRRSCSAWTVCR